MSLQSSIDVLEKVKTNAYINPEHSDSREEGFVNFQDYSDFKGPKRPQY